MPCHANTFFSLLYCHAWYVKVQRGLGGQTNFDAYACVLAIPFSRTEAFKNSATREYII